MVVGMLIADREREREVKVVIMVIDDEEETLDRQKRKNARYVNNELDNRNLQISSTLNFFHFFIPHNEVFTT